MAVNIGNYEQKSEIYYFCTLQTEHAAVLVQFHTQQRSGLAKFTTLHCCNAPAVLAGN